jgi:hypothetical protein
MNIFVACNKVLDMNMKIKAILFSSLLWLGLTFVSCSPEENDPIPTRTLLIYMAADNNLTNYSYQNIKSILEGAKGNNLNNGNLLIYHDSAGEPPRLIQIVQGAGGVMEEKIIRTYEDRNSVSVEVMRSVLAEVFGSEAYKAKSYALLLWSHGSAWLPSNVGDYLRSYGVDDGNHMEIYDLKKALQGYTFDFIIFDDCYMANIEVAYALRDNADYILASPTEVLAQGLPYADVVKYMFSSEPVSQALGRIGETFYTYYANQESEHYRSASTALVKTECLESLAAICREILAGKEEAIFNLPLANIQLLEYLRDTDHALYDLGDFIKQLATPKQYSRFENALKEVVLYKNTTTGAYYGRGGTWLTIDKDRFCGISVYVPQQQLGPLNEWYRQLDWYKAVYE